MNVSESVKIVDKVISERKTLKVLTEDQYLFSLASSIVEELLEAASWAPFHRPAAKSHCKSSELSSMVPWRFYILNGKNCRSLRQTLLEGGDSTKIPAMLLAATNLIQVTWLPDPKKSDNDLLYEPTLENMEHIAAASSAIQNLLIAATAREIQTYWSSGGGLRNAETMKLLGIPEEEILLGSIFLFGPITVGSKTAPGKLRNHRGERRTWSKWVEL
ncbi:MAG: nitroreductase family protein [Verrucomicrobia bacterium]|nr:nitroreductase family protein [Verrucomicrobiota bacterium]MDA1065023.1 nitroreductase family protein [Verrucomicrobiota bacterium]